ncbi:hypothetical protein Glove_22g28 [Diversispora epigaea]|nr:hypothetical protein Glove_22g28 [Diversispora epigaea]
MPLSDDVDLNVIAEQAEFYSGADLKNLCRESAMIALREMMNTTNVKMTDFQNALHVAKPSLTVEIIKSYQKFHKDNK